MDRLNLGRPSIKLPRDARDTNPPPGGPPPPARNWAPREPALSDLSSGEDEAEAAEHGGEAESSSRSRSRSRSPPLRRRPFRRRSASTSDDGASSEAARTDDDGASSTNEDLEARVRRLGDRVARLESKVGDDHLAFEAVIGWLKDTADATSAALRAHVARFHGAPPGSAARETRRRGEEGPPEPPATHLFTWTKQVAKTPDETP